VLNWGFTVNSVIGGQMLCVISLESGSKHGKLIENSIQESLAIVFGRGQPGTDDHLIVSQKHYLATSLREIERRVLHRGRE
jgi:hypothetical protein